MLVYQGVTSGYDIHSSRTGKSLAHQWSFSSLKSSISFYGPWRHHGKLWMSLPEGISSYIPLNPIKCYWITILIYPIKTPFFWIIPTKSSTIIFSTIFHPKFRSLTWDGEATFFFRIPPTPLGIPYSKVRGRRREVDQPCRPRTVCHTGWWKNLWGFMDVNIPPLWVFSCFVIYPLVMTFTVCELEAMAQSK